LYHNAWYKKHEVRFNLVSTVILLSSRTRRNREEITVVSGEIVANVFGVDEWKWTCRLYSDRLENPKSDAVCPWRRPYNRYDRSHTSVDCTSRKSN